MTPKLLGDSAHGSQHGLHVLRQAAADQALHLGPPQLLPRRLAQSRRPRRTAAARRQVAEQIGARHRADQPVIPQHRHEPLAAGHDQLLEFLDRESPVHGAEFPGHQFADRLVAQTVIDRFVGHLAGKDPADPPLVEHRHGIDIETAEQLMDEFHAVPGGNALDRCRHEVADLPLRMDMALQHPGETFQDLQQGQITDTGRRRRSMATAAEFGQDLAGIDFRPPRTGHQEDAAFHAHRHQQGIEVLDIAQLVGQRRDVADEIVDRRMGDADIDAVDVEHAAIGQQVVEQMNLVGGQFLGQHRGDDIQVGAVLEQKGRRLVIGGRGGGEGQAAGILVESEHHHGGFVGVGDHAAFHEQLGENGDGRTDGPDVFDFAVQIGGAVRMVIVDMEGDAGTVRQLVQRTDAVRLADIDQDQAVDLVEVDIAQLLEVEGILRAFQEKLAQRPLLPAGKDHGRAGVEPLRGDHRPQAVEVGVDVGGD